MVAHLGIRDQAKEVKALRRKNTTLRSEIERKREVCHQINELLSDSSDEDNGLP